jgi:Cofactor assembly of complex C subunit B, CCB2/CCB4
MVKPDPDRILRLMPLVVGGLGGTLLFINRLLTPELTNSQSRSDALGVIISAVLILSGLLWQRVQPRTPEAVELVGEEVFDLSADLPEAVNVELAWSSYSLLTNTATQSVVVWYEGRTLLRRGIMGSRSQVVPGMILQRVLETGKPVYLVALKLYPGRIEFDYLPENAQGVICQPLGQKGSVILAANAPRSYTKQDEAWIAAIANKLANTLETHLEETHSDQSR